MPKFQSTKSSFILYVGVNHPRCFCLLSSDRVWVQGIFVLTVTGFDNVCLHHRLLIIHRTDFQHNFIQCLRRKSNQINKMAAKLFTHLSVLRVIVSLLLSFPSSAQRCFVLMCGYTFIHSFCD